MKKRERLLSLSGVAAGHAQLPQIVRIGADATCAQGDFVCVDIAPGGRTQVNGIREANDFDARIPSLRAKTIAATLFSLSVTEKHRQEIAFSDKIYTANSPLTAASEDFRKQPVGEDYAFAGPAIKARVFFDDGVGLRKDDSELKAAFNIALVTLPQDGAYGKSAEKYSDFNVSGDGYVNHYGALRR